MKREIWKPVIVTKKPGITFDFTGLYEVSNFGRIRSLPKKVKCHYGVRNLPGRVIKPCVSNCGYHYVHLTKGKESKNFYVHIIVAQTFIPNPNNLPQVNHKNEDKTDNRVENLEWCTAYYNMNYGARPQKRLKVVEQYDLDGSFIREWDSISSALKSFNTKTNTISGCCKGKYKTAHGYVWCYKTSASIP